MSVTVLIALENKPHTRKICRITLRLTLGLNENIGREFADKAEHMSKVAMLNLHQYRVDVLKNKNFMALFKWIFQDRIGKGGDKKILWI